MEENIIVNLDSEFKKYLQIMRPHLASLEDASVIDLCNAWIQKLSNCADDEKTLRNKYAFTLCYQLAKGVLYDPFLKCPPLNKLETFVDIDSSEDLSTESECYLEIEAEKAKILFNNLKSFRSDTEYCCSLDQDGDDECSNNKIDDNSRETVPNKIELNNSKPISSFKQTFLCYQCPKIIKDKSEISLEKAQSLIAKLREMKLQNLLLYNELELIRRDAGLRNSEQDFGEECIKVDHACSAHLFCDASMDSEKSLQEKFREILDSKNCLIETIEKLQEKLQNYEENKRQQINELKEKHELELSSLQTFKNNEIERERNKIHEELKEKYKNELKVIQEKSAKDISDQEDEKDRILKEKDTLIETKDYEINFLRKQLQESKNNVQDFINKFLDKSPNSSMETEAYKIKVQQLENKLNRLEKSKMKYARAYECRIANLQREKQLAECSLQLQAVRQRAGAVSDAADEGQAQVDAALQHLEAKYRTIVANIQATAIQRRIHDQMCLEAILHSTCGIMRTENSHKPSGSLHDSNGSQLSAKPQPNVDFEIDAPTLLRHVKAHNVGDTGNKSFGSDSVSPRFCLDGERMGELFERMCIPQRDLGDGSHQK